MRTVAFIYGWSEGPWQSRRFRHELEARGHKVIKDPSDADVVIGHSSGCYLIPKNTSAKLTILIGPPYWPGQPLMLSVARNIATGFRENNSRRSTSWWVNKTAHNILYIITKPQASYNIAKMKPENLPVASVSQKVLLIRPEKDTFTHPNIRDLNQTKSYKFAEGPGYHENCWLNPAPYIDLIEQSL
jgi:hypothetical protein